MAPLSTPFSRPRDVLSETRLVAFGWTARAIGPRVGRVLLVQALLATLVSGLAASLVADLGAALRHDPVLRLAATLALCVAAPWSRAALSRTLDPPELVALRRQPVGTATLVLCTAFWTLPLAWPWAALAGIAADASPVSVGAAWIAGAVSLAGIAHAPDTVRTLGWAVLPIVTAWTAHALPAPVAPTLALATVPALARSLRRSVRSARPRARRARRHSRTPFGALVSIDVGALRRDARRWLPGLFPAALAAGYAVALARAGTCDERCLDVAALVSVSLCAPVCAAVLRSLARAHGTRLIVPDRTVSTRLRLASLGATTSAVPLACALAFLVPTREPALLPHAVAVPAVALWLRLRDPDRATTLGPTLWTLVPLTALLVRLPPADRLGVATLAAASFVALAARRARSLRAGIEAGRGRPRPEVS